MKKMISQEEKNSILFYQGAVEKIRPGEVSQQLTDFYRVPNAYEVINVLLMPGMENEKNRICDEGRTLEPILLQCMSELLNIYCNVYSAMCKYTYGQKQDKLRTYRSDRMHMKCCINKGKTGSFLSTSRKKKATYNFGKKNGILLLQIEAPGNIEHIDMNDVLGDDSKYPEENEVLFAPFLYCDTQIMEMDAEEMELKDVNGNPPQEKMHVKIKASEIQGKKCVADEFEMEQLKEIILKNNYIENALAIWEKLKNRYPISGSEKQIYIEWKEKIVRYLKLRFNEIKHQYMKDEYADLLEEDIQKYMAYTDSNRIKYDKQFVSFGIAISCLQPIGTLMIALSLLDEFAAFSLGAKIASLVINTICLILIGIVRNLSLGGKVQQRTRTYLRLDELQRDLKYEKDLSEENVEKYIARFKQIVSEDDTACEQNLEKHVKYVDAMKNDLGGS